MCCSASKLIPWASHSVEVYLLIREGKTGRPWRIRADLITSDIHTLYTGPFHVSHCPLQHCSCPHKILIHTHTLTDTYACTCTCTCTYTNIPPTQTGVADSSLRRGGEDGGLYWVLRYCVTLITLPHTCRGLYSINSLAVSLSVRHSQWLTRHRYYKGQDNVCGVCVAHSQICDQHVELIAKLMCPLRPCWV